MQKKMQKKMTNKKKGKKPKKDTAQDFLASCVKEIENATFLSDTPPFKVLRTCVPSLNRAFGPCMGLPLSRMTIIHGPNSAGKSALALILAKDFIEQGHMTVYVDSEHTLEEKWAKAQIIFYYFLIPS